MHVTWGDACGLPFLSPALHCPSIQREGWVKRLDVATPVRIYCSEGCPHEISWLLIAPGKWQCIFS